MNTTSDTGHKVAHGKRTDYFGKAAQGELPVVEIDPQGPGFIPLWNALCRFCNRWALFWVAMFLASAAIGFGLGFAPYFKFFNRIFN